MKKIKHSTNQTIDIISYISLSRHWRDQPWFKKNVFMLYLFHLKATTDIQTITTTAADQGSTFGMYIHFTFYKGS